MVGPAMAELAERLVDPGIDARPRAYWNWLKDDDGMPKWWIDVAVLAWPDNPDDIIPDAAAILNLTEHLNDGVLT